jgi:hypothetical protein
MRKPILSRILSAALAVMLAITGVAALAPPANVFAGGEGMAELFIIIRDKEFPRRFVLSPEDLSGSFVFENESGDSIEIDCAVAQFQVSGSNLNGYIALVTDDGTEAGAREVLVSKPGYYALAEYPELPGGYWFEMPEDPPGISVDQAMVDGEAYDGYIYIYLDVSSDMESVAPIEIYSAQDLHNVRNGLSGSYKLMNDIDLSGFNGGEWQPIGDSNNRFSGAFDGGGFAIRNMSISKGGMYIGLFGATAGALLTDVRLENTNIDVSESGGYNNYIGGLAGSVIGESKIQRCSNSGTITVKSGWNTHGYIGGLVGYVGESEIESCFNDSDIAYSNAPPADILAYIGGLAGQARTGVRIANCYNTGNIAASMKPDEHPMTSGFIGGIVGDTFSDRDGNRIEYCYSSGYLTSDDDSLIEIGGVGGYISYTQINFCYFINAEHAFAAISEYDAPVELNNVVRLDDQSMRQQDSFVGFDFGAVWGISDGINSGYPYLRALAWSGVPKSSEAALASLETDIGSLTPDFSPDTTAYDISVENSVRQITLTAVAKDAGAMVSGAGLRELAVGSNALEITVTAADKVTKRTYTIYATRASGSAPSGGSGNFLAPIGAPDPDAIFIYTAQDLYDVRDNLSGSYVLANDIDLADFNGGEWVPIGDNSTNSDISRFTGVFDGQGHVVQNLGITGDEFGYVGLFGYTNNAEIKNVGLEGTYINVTDANAGGIAGRSYNSNISNCYNTGDISASASAGGIAGNSSSSDISNCYNTGDISASASAGGITGDSFYSSISNCYNTGNIFASDHAGGIAGSAFGNISNCYNTGDISASASAPDYADALAGGIVGVNLSNSISNCYNMGDISASSASAYALAGGIAGESYSSISNCVVMSASIHAESTSGTDSISSNLIGYAGQGQQSNNLALSGIAGNAVNDADRLISADEAKLQSTYEDLGWDFGTVWVMVAGYDYPQFWGQHTIFLADLDKTYNGQPQGATVATLPEGLSYSVAYDGSATAPTDAGTYNVSACITEPGYSGEASGVLRIAKAPVTVQADSKSKKPGEADAALTYTIVSGALYGNDAWTGALSRAPGEAEGTYPITVGTLALNGNYEVTFIDGAYTIASGASSGDDGGGSDGPGDDGGNSGNDGGNGSGGNDNNGGNSNNNGGGGTSSGGSGGGSSAPAATTAAPEKPSESESGTSSTGRRPAATGRPANAADGFADIAGHWAEAYVRSAVGKGLFAGVSATEFAPESAMTRGMVATVLWRIAGEPAAAYAGAFEDVAAGQWYTDAIAWGAESGILNGYGDGRFGVDDSVTREQLAAIIHRYALLAGLDAGGRAELSAFADAAKFSAWATEAVQWAVQAGIVTGHDDGTFGPQDTATRAQVATIADRFTDWLDGAE